MFIEKDGQSLRTAKAAAAQNTINTNTTNTITTRMNTASGAVNNLVFINNSYNTTSGNVTQAQIRYNRLIDRITSSDISDYVLYFNFKAPATGIAEITAVTNTIQKSYGSKLLLSAGITYENTRFGGGNAFELYYDVGSGWVLWDRFYYRIEDSAQFNQFYTIISSLPQGNITIKIGMKDLSGESNYGEISEINFTALEVA